MCTARSPFHLKLDGGTGAKLSKLIAVLGVLELAVASHVLGVLHAKKVEQQKAQLARSGTRDPKPSLLQV